MHRDTPIDARVVAQTIEESRLSNIGRASIRELKRLVDNIEKATGQRFVRMEMGVPGLPANAIGLEAEMDALRRGVASIYPDIDGIAELKTEIARFVKSFIDIDVSPAGCLPTVGSMQGSYAAFVTVSRMAAGKDTTLFLDPGFPVHKQQHRVAGIGFESFDMYNYRGKKLRDKLESYLKTGRISCLLYSNPNNPSWICLTDEELRVIGELANRYRVVVLEDLAYLAMDFRVDMSQPGKPPYQPSAARYADHYILFISSSKIFSYAGQRIGMMVVSDKLFEMRAPDLKRYYGSDIFGHAMVFGTLYALSAGTSHAAQYALAAMLRAANEGRLDFVSVVREYGEKAQIMKPMFTDNGFKIVYDTDVDRPIADGFYFTFAYPGFTGEELLERLLYYGVSAIALGITGSERTEGLRACVSLVDRKQFPDLAARLRAFHVHHPLP